jgi:uncharacterized protein YabE (DUF348 family)
MNINFESFSSFVKRHAFASGVFAVIFGFVFFSFSLVAANGQTLGPSDNHIVSFYSDNATSSIPTRAETVGDFLEKAQINMGEFDIVEPSKDTKITEDNFRISVYKARPVTIIDGDNTAFVMTPHKSPRLIAEKAGITTYPEDNVELSSVNQFIEEQTIGEKLTIDRATPVSLSLYGAPSAVYRTRATTVGEFLKQNNITPEAGATISPAESTTLTGNMSVFISKFGKKTITEEVEIPFDKETTNDPNQPAGKITVTSPGTPGKKQVTYELDLRDDKEIGRRTIQEVVTAQPVKQTQTRGTKVAVVTGDKVEWMRAAGISESEFAAVDFIIGRESGWRPAAMNAGGCGGLGQACPVTKLARVCPNWQTDPVCQLNFFGGYAKGRYGSWTGAYNFWLSNRWW